MEQKVTDAAQALADALKAERASSAKLRGVEEDKAQKALAEEYRDFESAVKARRERFAGQFNDADDDTAEIDNPSDLYLRFAVEGDDYMLKPGSNKVVSYSAGIPATRIAAIASAQLFSPHGVTMKLTSGKRSADHAALIEAMSESHKKESEERSALEARLRSERAVKDALQTHVVQRIQDQATASIVRATMPPPAPLQASDVKGKAAPSGTPVMSDTKETKAEAKQRKKEEAKVEADRKPKPNTKYKPRKK